MVMVAGRFALSVASEYINLPACEQCICIDCCNVKPHVTGCCVLLAAVTTSTCLYNLCCRSVFNIDPTSHAGHMKAAQNFLSDGTSQWSARIAVTGIM